MKRKNASKGPQLKRKPDVAKKPITKTVNPKWILIGAAALIAVVIFTAGLVRHYGAVDGIVARINGMAIRESEVVEQFINRMHNDQEFQMMVEWGMIPLQTAIEDTAREIALHRIFEDYARRNNIPHDRGGHIWWTMNAVIDAIDANPARFADFEAYMPRDAEAIAAGILERALAGEDFDELVAAYNEDGMPPEGYVFFAHEMVSEFSEAVLNLEIGEISGSPVQTQFGFHLVKRIEPPEDAEVTIGGIPIGEDDEALAAKHILFRAEAFTYEERRRAAVLAGFEAKRDANLVFLPGFADIQL